MLYSHLASAGPTSRSVVLAVTLALATGLVSPGCTSYEPAPINAQKSENDFRARTLNNTDLAQFVQRNHLAGEHSWPPSRWGLRELEAAAFFYNPEIAQARRAVQTAEAAVISAGERPNPTLAIVPEYIPNPSAGLAPWALGITLDVPIEIAGKRGLRIDQAKRTVDSARLAQAELIWKVRSQVRAALVDYGFDGRELLLIRREIELRETVVQLLERRLEAGESSRFEVNAAQADLTQARLALTGAKGKQQQTLIALAGILGVPTGALASSKIDAVAEPAALRNIPAPEKLHSAGLLNRIDLRRALADYGVAETALRLEIAKQYPDLHLTPGYMNDQGEHRLSLGPSVTLPVFSQNKGPIAEAAARRAQAATAFENLQGLAINETDQAQASLTQSERELSEIDAMLTNIQRKAESLTQRALAAGESDRLALATVQLQGALLERSRLEAEHRTQIALGALEDAVQRPLASPDLEVGTQATLSPLTEAKP